MPWEPPAAVYPVAGLIESTLHDETGIVAQDETPEALAAGLLDLMKRPERYPVFFDARPGNAPNISLGQHFAASLRLA